MADAKSVYEDDWGEIIDRPSSDVIELRWFDTTTSMSKPQFQQWLTGFADHVGRLRRSRVLVDGTNFKVNPAFMDGGWRDAHIIPKYNAAGVASFAFHMPVEMPMVGKPPAREDPGQFPTGYFSSRKEAIGWLKRREGA